MLKRLTKLPPSIDARSAPTCCMLRPIDATLSRSMTISALAWSICTSMIGGNANWPLFIASLTSCSAKRSSSSWLAVEAMHELDREDARRWAAPAAGTPARGRR